MGRREATIATPAFELLSAHISEIISDNYWAQTGAMRAGGSRGWTVERVPETSIFSFARARRAAATLERINCVRSGTLALCPQQCLPREHSGGVCLFLLNKVVKFVAYLT